MCSNWRQPKRVESQRADDGRYDAFPSSAAQNKGQGSLELFDVTKEITLVYFPQGEKVQIVFTPESGPQKSDFFGKQRHIFTLS